MFEMIDFYCFFYSCLKGNKEIINLINNFIKQSNVYVFGGFVRDYLYGQVCKFRDIDIVVDIDIGLFKKMIFNLISKDNIINNQFDGYKLKFGNLNIDIWTLEETWAIKNGFFSKNELLKTVYLNIDAYAYNLTNKDFLDMCNYVKKPNKLDICFEINPNEELNIARSVVLSKKYNIIISEKIKSKMIELSNSREKIEKFFLSQIKHYGKIEVCLEELIYIANEKEKNNVKYML